MANYRYLGYGITNEQGIATLDHDANGNPIDHSYTGTGAGEIDIVASLDDNTHISDSSLQSEIFVVSDTIWYFDGVNNTGEWSGANTVATATENGVRVTSTHNNIFLSKDNNQLIIPTNNDFCIEFTGIITNPITLSLTTQATVRGSPQITINTDTTAHLYQFKYINGVLTQYKDNVLVNSMNRDVSSVSNCGVMFVDWQGDMDITVKDFKVYPI